VTLQIGSHKIGADHPALVIAELSGNHHQDYQQACDLIRAAADAGADMVKTQCFTPDAMTMHLDAPTHRLTWNGRDYTLWDLYAETAMPMAWHEPLMALANSLGLLYTASVFDQVGIDLGERLGFPAYKVASFELTHTPLIRAIARTGKLLLLSTGMATEAEITASIEAMAQAWHDIPTEIVRTMSEEMPFIVMRCTTAYPAPIASANLRTIHEWLDVCTVGLSDHSRSNSVVSAAVALGARVVERHLTLSRSLGGPDAPFSDEPHEFAAMVRAIRDVEAALGTVHYGPTESEVPMLRYRRSLWVTRDVTPGESLTPDNIAALRPTGGLAPAEWDSVIGHKATRALARGEPLTRECVEA
jgi:pseudaminic acid synthase